MARRLVSLLTASDDIAEPEWVSQIMLLCKICVEQLLLQKGVGMLLQRGQSEQAARSGRDLKSIVFYLKSVKNLTILSAGAGRSRRPGAAGTQKVSVFIENPFKK